MFRHVTTTALAAAVVALTPAAGLAQSAPGGPVSSPPAMPPPAPAEVSIPTPPPAQAVPPPAPLVTDKGKPAADTAAMADAIRNYMKDNAYGFQFAIAQHGKLAATGQGGYARSAVDNKGKAVAMAPSMRMELASLTKNFTAVTTMKLLRAHGRSIDDSVDAFLPSGWTRGGVFKTKKVTFRHLLEHTSGISQMINKLPKADRPGNGWAGMQAIVAKGTNVVGSQREYKNANYALLRLLNANMWFKLGHRFTTTETIEIENSHGATKTIEKTVVVPVDSTSASRYVLDAMRVLIFNPAGIAKVSCTANATTAAMSYPLDGTLQTPGKLLSTSSETCAGHRGLQLSAIDVVRYLVHLRHGSIIEPSDLARMDAFRLGWNEDSDGADGGQYGGPADGKADNKDSIGAYWHGGALLGTYQIATCGMTFSDGTEASIIVNSAMAKGSKCGALLTSWHAAR